MTWVKDLIKDYRKSRSMMIKYRDSIDPLAEWQEVDLVQTTVASMNYAIEWMRTGRQPYSRRGVDRRKIYHEPYVLDKDLFPSLQDPEPANEPRYSSEERRIALELIRSMTDRERDCFLLHAAQGLSMAAIAKELKISKRTVQQSIDRAKKKIPVAQ
ncbi:sigma-70 family RNA polymerase sigma factor [Cohnella cholangitidis]|uniref:Sigma-70 family RNA polymerase sigma factor n=1 Tax=Cohnella cholangitidis TaxID=2598458 RepID=A0A7G5C5H3_9BACL|nr:sigma-70 family RNA polymerase sigma factor [Cohnella cholangitidis]QMV44457.1 sigma-70 family RNA polymerase sigma factor [Cohnella cholangitidis]